MSRFALKALQSANRLALNHFNGQGARGLFAGLAAHSLLPLNAYASASFGLVLAILGHAVGWPIPLGGSQSITQALLECFKRNGGIVFTGFEVESLEELPTARTLFFDVTPRQFLKIAGKHLPHCYKSRMSRYRYGMGVFKIDWALNEPIPWKSETCRNAGTIHLGGTLEEISASEMAVSKGTVSEKPFIILAQQSNWDSSRAPAGKQTAWAYCHVPNGSTQDMTEKIEAQIERHAPGFKDCILEKHTINTRQFERYNANYIGGDINGGSQDITQLFTRPIARLSPYSTPLKGVYLCSSSTPPGGGVHGMCGYNAAQKALKDISHS
jgi:phytoene dehydrogenase-like protein